MIQFLLFRYGAFIAAKPTEKKRELVAKENVLNKIEDFSDL